MTNTHSRLDALGRHRLDIELPTTRRGVESMMREILSSDGVFPGDTLPWRGSLARTVAAHFPDAGRQTLKLAGRTFDVVDFTPRRQPGVAGLLRFFLDFIAQSAMYGLLKRRAHQHYEAQIVRRTWGADVLRLVEHKGVPVALVGVGILRGRYPLSRISHVTPRARRNLRFSDERGVGCPFERAAAVDIPFMIGHSAFIAPRRSGLGIACGYALAKMVFEEFDDNGIHSATVDERGKLDATTRLRYYVAHSDKIPVIHLTAANMERIPGTLPRQRNTAVPYPIPRPPRPRTNPLMLLAERIAGRAGLFRPYLGVDGVVSDDDAMYRPGIEPHDVQQSLFIAAFEAITPPEERMDGLFDVRAGVDRSLAPPETSYPVRTLPDGREISVVPDRERWLQTAPDVERLLGERLGFRGIYVGACHTPALWRRMRVGLLLRYQYRTSVRTPCRAVALETKRILSDDPAGLEPDAIAAE